MIRWWQSFQAGAIVHMIKGAVGHFGRCISRIFTVRENQYYLERDNKLQ